MTRSESMTFKDCYTKLKTFLEAVDDSVLNAEKNTNPDLKEVLEEAKKALGHLGDNINELGKEFNRIVEEAKDTQQEHFRNCPRKIPSIPG